MPHNNNRPVFLDLARIRLPITAIISIAHRMTGIVLFLSIPFAIYLLGLSLSSQQQYNHVQELLGHKTLASTEKYTHVSLEQLSKLCNTIHPLKTILKQQKVKNND